VNIIDAILEDPSVSPDFKRHIATPQAFLSVTARQHLEARHDKADRRRFYERPEPVTGFGTLDAGDDIHAKGSERYLEVRAEERADELRDLQLDRDQLLSDDEYREMRDASDAWQRDNREAA